MNEEKALEVHHFDKPLEIPSFARKKTVEEEPVQTISNSDVALICFLTIAILTLVAIQLGVLMLRKVADLEELNAKQFDALHKSELKVQQLEAENASLRSRDES